MFYILLHPLQLVLSQTAQPTGFQVHYVHQPDEVHAFLIKAVPAATLTVFAIALQVLLAVIADHIMLAGNVEYFFRAGALENLLHGIKLFRLRKMSDVTRVENEARLFWKSVDLCHRRLQRANHVRISGLVEPHMAVTDLDKAELTLHLFAAHLRQPAQAV